ncbi:MAG: HAMP domain-containing sensor histidine kinase [Aquabacterium sp.]|nr:HAMP domain-containing sensor histidine kinase [Aquabacterium sp.]
MASPTSAYQAAGSSRHRQLSELACLLVAGHFAVAGYYGLFIGQWAIAAVLALSALPVLGLVPLVRSTHPPSRIRGITYVVLLINLLGFDLALMWMGLSASVAVWALIWWPICGAQSMGFKDGLMLMGLCLASALLIGLNQSQAWVSPHMLHEQNPVWLMQLICLVVGVSFGLIVRRAQGRIRIRIEAVKQSSLDRSQLFAQISHEVRNPLNGMMGFAQLLNTTPLTPQQKGYVQQIHRCGDMLTQLINDVLDFSRLETHSSHLVCEPFDLILVANEAADMVSSIADQKGVALIRDFPCGDLAAVGDALRVKQVLLNLLANAVKFTATGEVTVRCRALQLGDGQAGLHVEVQDSGIGIPEDVMGHLFQPFSKASDKTMRQYGGSGLGLAICKRLVDMMKGQIGVSSQLGQGSLFWFEMPAQTSIKA